jgi:hypothetical protein
MADAGNLADPARVSIILYRVNRFTIAFALALLTAPEPCYPIPRPQDQAPAPPTPKKPAASEIFSGMVTDLSAESLTVVRSGIARESVKRTFILDAQTTVEGKLKAKARVSVRYATEEDGQFRALHIIVR